MASREIAAGPGPTARRAREYARDGWELGGAALAVASRGTGLRKFAAGAYAGVAAVEIADAVSAVALHGELTLPAKLGWAVASTYLVALLSNLAGVGLAGLVDSTLDRSVVRPAEGWRLMRRRFAAVAGWALIVVVIGIPARLLTSWGIDQVAAVLLGFGWAVVSFFAVPAMALGGDGPIGAGIRSLALVGRQWGSQVVGMVYVWLRPAAFIGLPGVLLAAAGVVLALAGDEFVGWAVGATGVLAVAFAYLLIVTANSVLCVALYRFAHGQALPPEFDPETLERVLRPPTPRTVRIVRRLDSAATRRARARLQRLVEER